MPGKIRNRSAHRKGSRVAGQISRRDLLKGTASLGLALGARPALAQSAPGKGGPVTLNLLLWEHWKVVEGLQKNDPATVPKRRLWFYETIKRFEAEHPDIKLQYQTAKAQLSTRAVRESTGPVPL